MPDRVLAWVLDRAAERVGAATAKQVAVLLGDLRTEAGVADLLAASERDARLQATIAATSLTTQCTGRDWLAERGSGGSGDRDKVGGRQGDLRDGEGEGRWGAIGQLVVGDEGGALAD